MMIKTYRIVYHGPECEKMIRTMDRYFRAYYNVYGGKREASYKDAEGQVVVMSYTAGWDTTGFWPGFKGILKGANKSMNRQDVRWSEEENDGGSWYEVEE